MTVYTVVCILAVLANTDVNRIFFQQSSYSFTPAETCNLDTIAISQTRLLIKEGKRNITTT